MIKAKKSECANSLNQAKHLRMEHGFTAAMLKDALAEGLEKQK